MMTAATVATAMLLAACSGADQDEGSADASDALPTAESDASSDSASTAPPRDEPTEAAKTILQAYAANDPTACTLQTDAYTEAEIRAGVEDDFLDEGADCDDLVEVVASFTKQYSLDPSTATYKELSNDGRTAKVEVSYDDDNRNTLVFVKADAGWLLDGED